MKKTLTGILTFTLALVMLLGMCSFASAEAAINDVPCKTVELEENDPGYYAALWEAELYNYKMIRNFTTMYVKADWDAYRDACVNLDRMDSSALTDEDKQVILNAKQAREKLVQVIPYAEEALFIWGEDMPILTADVESQFTAEGQDNADFRPFLIPYLLEDPSLA